ncbi:DMT family transporter [Sphingobacterium sp. HMA12]|uniref:DMT family transporter n=1 Tax=Sphingobacterium sp. HMA12 TaxID=2050894 RepID=UPI000CEA27F5|nr:DMT family transporter [Sphingobacterium sp. HMA12]
MKKAFFLLHIAIVLAGLSAIFGKLIILNEVLLTWYRMLFATIILFIASPFLKESAKTINRKNYFQILSVGFLLGLHWVFFYGSIKYANISVGVVCFCLTGFFTSILGPLIKRQKASWIEILLSLLTLIGIFLIFSFDTMYRTGIILGIISSLLVALFTIFNEKLSKDFDAIMITRIEMLGGTVGIGVLLPMFLYFNPVEYLVPTLTDTGLLVLLAGVCTVLMYVLLNKALKYISAFTVNLNFNLEPIYSIILAVVFFKEYSELSLPFFIGLALIALSLGLQMNRVLRTKG